MSSSPSRRRAPLLVLLATALGLAVAFPLQALGASPAATFLTDGAPPVHRWAATDRADEHVADWPLITRAGIPVWRFQARVTALQAIAVAKAAAEQAAAEAAAQAAVEKAARATAAAAAAAAAATPTYSGTNRLWMPSLGVSRSVEGFACSRSTPPANVVYRWGCAGDNNAYLFGHAWGVFKPLHDAYVGGRLGAGMVVVYADGAGVVRTYRVTEIRVVTPDQVDWAIAAQSQPSLTLQTCVGANSEQRLLVRLVSD